MGQSQVFTTAQDIEGLVVGDPAVADVVVISSRSFYILGQSLGQTNLQIFADEDTLIGLVDLAVTVDTGDLASVLRGVGLGSNVKVDFGQWPVAAVRYGARRGHLDARS